MDRARVTRLRWRMRGAWLWPTFVVLTVADGAIVHFLPLSGDSESAVSGGLIACVLSLIGIAAVAPGVAVVLRRVRRDMPTVVARDYAGTAIVVTVSAVLLACGLAHHASVGRSDRDMEDATARAVAYIGDHAPAPFAANLRSANTYEVQAGRVYRVCVTDPSNGHDWCVVVDRSKPFGTGVTYAGSEPNQTLAQGTS